MLGIIGISALFGGLFNFGLVAALFGTAWYYAKRAFGEDQLPSWTGMPAAYYRDALWIGPGGAAAVLGLQALLQTATQHWPTAHRSIEAAFGSGFDAIQPAGAIGGSALAHGLVWTAFVALVASFVGAQLLARWMRFLAFLFGAAAMVGNSWGNPADFAKEWLAQALFLGAIIFGVRRVIKFNILGCFLVLATIPLVDDGVELLSQPDSFYRRSGYAVVALLLLLLAWPFLTWWTRKASESTSTGAPAT